LFSAPRFFSLFTGKYREIQGNTGKYREIQGNTGKYREIQGNTGKYREIQGKRPSRGVCCLSAFGGKAEIKTAK
jgi:hypothetical protein